MKNQREESLIEQMISVLNIGNNAAFDEIYIDTAFRIKDFIDKLPGGFLIYNADGDEEIYYANKALIRMFGCDTFEQFRELTGNSFKGIVYHEDLDEVEKSIVEQIQSSSDDLDYVEYRIMDKDGALHWVEDYGHYVRTSSLGNIYYVFISEATEKIRHRITERNNLIKEKDEKEQKLKILIEEYDKERKLIRQEHLQRLEVIEGLSVNYDSILYADLDADKVLPYRLSSRLQHQFEKKLQTADYSRFRKEYVRRWVHPEDRDTVEKMLEPDYIRKKLTENRTYYLNFRCIENGETKYLQLRLVDVTNDGHISQIVMGYRSIDDEVLQEMKQKKLLEEALNNAKLAYVAKNTFLSNMSHDMRTPLNALFGYTALARKNADDAGAVGYYLDKIETAGKQILDLVDRVLEISYIETQDYHISECACNVCEVANEVFGEIKPKAEKKNISVHLRLDCIEHGDVYADKDKLKQLLYHIASNAVNFTESGGTITFIAEEQKSVSDEFAPFRFIVEDTGIGIAEDALQRIFEPFERERNTTASGVYGSGLGLTIAKHIIEMMGGSIEAKSELGKGSTFTVSASFRLQNKITRTANGTDGVSEELLNKKILLVDDNEINLEIECEMLEDAGYVVETAENGKIAVEKVAASSPDEYLFVLMDIQMPVMDGREATREIRKLDGAHGQIPIIALSANAFESDKRLSLECGMDDHLTKPVDIPLLIETVNKVLKTRKK